MKVLVIGGGGREHALCWVLSQEPGLELVCAPGNPGIARIARCVPADVLDPAGLVTLARTEGADLTIVGPEAPLSAGVADAFAAAGLPIFGPTRAAAALEWSKGFAKAFMARHGVPTARFRTCESAAEACAAVDAGELGFPVVVKADGLAAGKGVVIADDRQTAVAAITEMMSERRFGTAGDRVVLEEFLVGEEASYFVIADGERWMPLGSAQDHKRIFDDDRGPNTGGMGAFAPTPLMSAAAERRVLDEIVSPVLTGMAAEGTPFRGFLYVGLMLTASGPRVVEFNVRFGDPEAQVILPCLGEALSPLLVAAARGELPDRRVTLRDECAVGVVLASRGYPESSDSGRVISGLAEAETAGALVFHAGTSASNGAVVTSGGRVLTVVGRGARYQDAITQAYGALARISFDGMQFRRDIGRKALGVRETA